MAWRKETVSEEDLQTKPITSLINNRETLIY